MKKFIIIAAAVALLGLGCSKQTTESTSVPTDSPDAATAPIVEEVKDPNQPLQYDLGDLYVTTERSLSLVRKLYTAEQLVAQSAECGTNLNLEYFAELLPQFRNQRVQRYNFLYRGESQTPINYSLTVIANGPGYEDLASFKQDLDVCGSGGSMIPLQLNENWLILEGNCEKDADDGSDLPTGCEIVREQVLKTLRAN